MASMLAVKSSSSALLSLLIVLALLVACGPTPAPVEVEKVVTQVIKETVEVERMVTTEVKVLVTPQPDASQQGGTLIVGLATDSIITLDPAAYSDRITETVIRNMFDGLVTRTTDNQVVPELARSYSWLDNQTIEFELKRGVKFHNGEELTADDVVFTFERILTEDIGARRRGFVKQVDSVEKLGDYTVRFNLKSPWPVFLQMLVHNQIVPQDYLTEVGDEEFARNPVGAGPFKFAEGKLDEQIILERFDGYYGGAHHLAPIGPPYLERVIFRMVPDTATRVAALLAGELHIIQSVPPHMVPQLIDDPELVVKTTSGTRPKLMDLNVTSPPFDDRRVRQALNYAVDAETILAQVAGGYGAILPGPLSPENLYADPDLVPYGYDPDLAVSLLEEAGYQPEDLAFVIDAYGPYVELAEAVAGQLGSLGMDVSVRTWEYDIVAPLLLNCERQAFLRDWGDSAFDPVGYVEAKWHTRVEDTPEGRGNFACYSNPQVDELIEAGASEPDPEARHRVYDEMQRLILEDAPSVFLYVPQEIEASSATVHGWEPSPDSRINLHDVWLSD